MRRIALAGDLFECPLDAPRYPNGCIGYEVVAPKQDEPLTVIAIMYVGPPVSRRVHRWEEERSIGDLPYLAYQAALNNDPSRWLAQGV